jgi:lipoyl(octanoyl) transferase
MIAIKQLPLSSYQTIWEDMKTFTMQRDAETPDELWLLEHEPVYTQGQAGKPEHLLNPKGIPVVQSDRGGQITYHGPGQLVGYVLMDIKRKNIGIRTLVCKLERILIDMLNELGIEGHTSEGAPGVYVKGSKIASIGLRVKNGCTYHGIALNVAMDLSPFQGINPCGYKDMSMTQIQDIIPSITIDKVTALFRKYFLTHFETN